MPDRQKTEDTPEYLMKAGYSTFVLSQTPQGNIYYDITDAIADKFGPEILKLFNNQYKRRPPAQPYSYKYNCYILAFMANHLGFRNYLVNGEDFDLPGDGEGERNWAEIQAEQIFNSVMSYPKISQSDKKRLGDFVFFFQPNTGHDLLITSLSTSIKPCFY